jgi:hypothetical protein
LRRGLARGRVWLAGLTDRGAWALSGSGVGRAAGLGFAWAKTAPGRRRRGEGRPAVLALWDGLSSGLGLVLSSALSSVWGFGLDFDLGLEGLGSGVQGTESNRLTGLCDGLL